MKTGQAGERWNSYKEATTLGELAERNPGRFFLDDLKYDYEHGLVRLGVAGTQGVAEVRSVVGALDLLEERAQAAGAAGYIDQRDDEARWGATHPTLARISELEGMEGSPAGPMHSGEPGAMAEILRTSRRDSGLA